MDPLPAGALPSPFWERNESEGKPGMAEERIQPDKWGAEASTPTVQFYHSAIRQLVAERFAASGLSWEEAVQDPKLELTRADFAKMEGTLTHHSPLSGDIAAAVVTICSELVRGAVWKEAVEAACVRGTPETQTALTNHQPGSLDPGGFVPDVLAAAAHFVGTSGTFNTALDASLSFAGGANYSPVLVGSMGGARWGASSIADTMLDHCDILPRVRLVAATLASRWGCGK